MSARGRSLQRHWLLVGVLLLAAGLRLYRLGADSLWYDETVSVHLATKDAGALIAHTAGDIHPPGYYLLLHAWARVAGAGDYAVAYASVFFGLVLVAVTYRLGRAVYGPGAASWAALLVATSPYNVWYSQEVRMYTLGATLAVGVLLAVVHLARSPGRAPSRRWLAVYALCAAVGLWTLYYFAFLLVAVNLIVGLWWLVGRWPGRRQWRWLGWWAAAQGLALILYAPWLPIAWRQATQPPVPPWRGFTGLGALTIEAWSALSLGQSMDPARAWPVLLLFVLLFVLGLVARWRAHSSDRIWPGRGFGPWLMAGAVLLPVLLIYLASFVTPLYHVRYAFTYAAPFYVLCGAGLAWLAARWRTAAALGLAAVLVASSVSLFHYHRDVTYAADDHRSAVRFLSDAWRPGDAILVNAGYAYTALAAYWGGEPIAGWQRLVGEGGPASGGMDRARPVVYQTGSVDGDPSLGWGAAESDFYAMPRVQAFEALEALFGTYDRVWVYRIYDTVTDPDGALRSWLDEQGTRFADEVYTGESQLRVQGYLTGRDPTMGLERRDASLSGNALHLVARSPLPAELEIGGTLDLTLAWRVEKSMPAGAILFAGLFDGEDRRWAQVDERPSGLLYPASAWAPGDTVPTPLRLGLPPGMPPGTYSLEVGWYRFVEGQPVWLPWAEDVQRLVLGKLDVVPPQEWASLPLPEPSWPLGLKVGPDLRLLGFDGPVTEAHPGQLLSLALYWQALADGPGPGPTVLSLQSDGEQIVAERSAQPLGGRVPFSALTRGQTLCDPWTLELPSSLAPGVYSLVVGQREPDGAWSQMRRGMLPLGSSYPLATIRVLGRPLDLEAPAVQHPLQADFGGAIRLMGFESDPPLDSRQDAGTTVHLTLHWQALAPTMAPYKLFVHLVGDGGPGDIRTQADQFPRIPTSGWQAGEYLSEQVALDLPAELEPERYSLLIGWYEEASGRRLPVASGAGVVYPDAVELARIDVGD